MHVRRWFGCRHVALDGRTGRSPAISALRIACFLAGIAGSSPGSAQVAFSIAAESDYRFRGASLTAERPTAGAHLSYDDPSGLYANASTIGVYRNDGPDLFNVQGNIGYAKRLSSIASIDGGLVHSRYRWPTGLSGHRNEAYIGVHVSDFAARVSYSPHYFQDDVSILYGEAEAGFQPAPNWRLSARAGVLAFLRAPGPSDDTTRYDWRVSVSRQWSALEIHSALSGGGPNRGMHGATAATAGVALNF
jgi:uncharacterized protein (TIGR02001 family)